LTGRVIQIGDGDGSDANFGAVEADGGGYRCLFGADGEAVGGVFNVAAGDNVSVGEKYGGADAEAAVRGVGVVSYCGCLLLEVLDLSLGGAVSVAGCRHDMSEAIGCVVRWQGRYLEGFRFEISMTNCHVASG